MGKVKEFIYDIAFQIIDGDYISPEDLSGEERDDIIVVNQAITEFIADEILLVDRETAEFLDKRDTRIYLFGLIRDQLLHVDETFHGEVNELYKKFREDHSVDDLNTDFRSWEDDHDIEKDEESPYSTLVNRHPDLDFTDDTHQDNEDPTHIYESKDDSIEWLDSVYYELRNTQGLDDTEAQVLLDITRAQLDEYFRRGERPSDVAKEIANNQQLMNNVYDTISTGEDEEDTISKGEPTKKGHSVYYHDSGRSKDYNRMNRRQLEAEIDAALERGDTEELKKISQYLPESVFNFLYRRRNNLYIPRLFEAPYEDILRRGDYHLVEELLVKLEEKFKDDPRKLRKVEQMKKYIPGKMNKFFDDYSRLMNFREKIIDLEPWMIAYID